MGRMQGAGRLGHDPGRLARRQGARALDDRGEILAVDQLHDDERAGRVLAVVVDADDVRVVERGGGLGLVAEARAEVGVAAIFGTEDLDGHIAVELVVVAAIDPGHAALTQQLHEPVAPAEDRPDLAQINLDCGTWTANAAGGARRAGRGAR